MELGMLPSHEQPLMGFLSHIASLATTYSQVAAAKDLAASLPELLGDMSLPAGSAAMGARLYLEVLFLENSLPLNRTVISDIVKSCKFLYAIDSALVSLCEENGNRPRRPFAASRAVLSLTVHPKLGFLGDALGKCVLPVASGVVVRLRGVVCDVGNWWNPFPSVMEQSQEAMSCSYYLL